MATDESARAEGSMWLTGQMNDAVSDPSAAMTAPGSPLAQDVSPFRREPDPAQVHPERGDWRELEHGESGQPDAHAWDDLSCT